MKNVIFAQVEAACKLKGLNEREMGVVKKIFDELPPHQREDWMNKFRVMTRDEVLELNGLYSQDKMNNSVKFLAQSGKMVTIKVAGKYGYIHTVGLSTIHDDSHELVILAGLPRWAGDRIVDEVIARFPNGGYSDESFELVTVVLPDDRHPLARVIEYPEVEDIVDGIMGTVEKWTKVRPKKVYQIMISDADRRLPGEEGYDRKGLPQTLENCLMGKTK